VGRILFVTGTDTGVGKTVFTALLLRHLRATGISALAMKPFCTGPRWDVRLLQSLQPGILGDDEVNPVWLQAPLAPHFAALRQGRRVNLRKVREAVGAASRRCEVLLVEGAGGVLVPLTARETVADFMAQLAVECVVVAPNRIGVINQVGLTVEALRKRGVGVRSVVLMDPARLDPSSSGNVGCVRKTLAGIDVFRIPHLGANASKKGGVERGAKKMKKVLARLWGVDIVCPRSLERFAKAGRPSADKKTKKSR
jgi:dethiobiotin synthetase